MPVEAARKDFRYGGKIDPLAGENQEKHRKLGILLFPMGGKEEEGSPPRGGFKNFFGIRA